MQYYEDYELDHTTTAGSFSPSKAEIVAFAEEYDPLWIHVDESRAERESPFGGIVASGWHTVACCHRELVHGTGEEAAALGSPGVDGISWNHPVYPDDTITVSRTVVGKEASETPPDRGLVTVEVSATNQRGEEVLTYRPSMYFLREGATGP